MNWRKEKLGGGRWEIVVVVVGAWKGSGRWTETLPVTFSWVIWIDRPTWWQQCHQSGFSHPQLPISGDLKCDIGFLPSHCLYTASFIHVLLHSDAYIVSFLIVRSDINFLWARLFSRQSPPVYVMRSFLLLLRLGALLLQLLSLELRPPVLKPHFYLQREKKEKGDKKKKPWISVTR